MSTTKGDGTVGIIEALHDAGMAAWHEWDGDLYSERPERPVISVTASSWEGWTILRPDLDMTPLPRSAFFVPAVAVAIIGQWGGDWGDRRCAEDPEFDACGAVATEEDLRSLWARLLEGAVALPLSARPALRRASPLRARAELPAVIGVAR